MNSYKILFYIIVCLIISACGNSVDTKKDINPDNYKKGLENANKKLTRTEELGIEGYIERYGWKMNKTGSGLRIDIYSEGKGAEIRNGDLVKIKFKVNLINGTEVYNSDIDGVKQIEIGHSGVESGLEEALKFMHNHDKAKLIIPSYLAFGLLGDDNKIPKRATLIYNIEVIDVKLK